jgi:hypothetical protein
MKQGAMMLGLALVAAPAGQGMARAAASAEPAYLTPADRPMVRQWLAAHPGYRLLTDDDCRCDDDIRGMRHPKISGRWAKPDFHPYYTRGDFDRDGRQDLAVGVHSSGERGQFRVLVLSKVAKPFLSDPFLLGDAIFKSRPGTKPDLLLVGGFETEVGSLEPKRGGGYRYVPSDCC